MIFTQKTHLLAKSLYFKHQQEDEVSVYQNIIKSIQTNKLPLKNKDLYDKSRNYGFKTDLARYEILNKYGGLYIDTDFECLSPIPENFLNFDFVSCIVFSNEPQINNAIMMTNRGGKICLAAFPHENVNLNISHMVINNIYMYLKK